MSKSIDRAEQLIKEINYHDTLYFTENRSEISDEAYDSLWFELKELLANPEVKNASRKLDMPLGAQNSFLDKVKHLVPVKSLDKIKSKDKVAFKKDIQKFIKKYCSNKSARYVLESKLDGLTIVIYKSANGDIKFVTRGGSDLGENVTSQFEKIESIYKAAKAAPNGIIIRGEAIIPKKSFTKFEEEYSNARNLASSQVRTKDECSAAKYDVHFVAYDILSHHSTTEEKDLELMKKFGFEVVKHEMIESSEDLSSRIYEAIMSTWREDDSYELDGLVLKPNEKDAVILHDGHHQKGQIAIKFPPAGAETIVREVIWQIGGDGRMTPVIKYDPIEIGGVTLEKASMGSYSVFKKSGIRKNDKIWVIRSNDVIPQFDAILETSDSNEEFEIPANTWTSGAHLFTEIEMPKEEAIARFAKAVGVKSSNAKTFKLLLDADLINNFSDLYDLKNKKADMLKVKGLGSKKVDLLLDEIELSKRATFEKVLSGMQMKAVGTKMSKDLAVKFTNAEELINASESELKSVKSVNAPALKTLLALKDSGNKDKENLLAVIQHIN